MARMENFCTPIHKPTRLPPSRSPCLGVLFVRVVLDPLKRDTMRELC